MKNRTLSIALIFSRYKSNLFKNFQKFNVKDFVLVTGYNKLISDLALFTGLEMVDYDISIGTKRFMDKIIC